MFVLTILTFVSLSVNGEGETEGEVVKTIKRGSF
jgi:hypothetical protein